MKKSTKHLVKAIVYAGAAGANLVAAKYGILYLSQSFPYKTKFEKGLDMAVGIGSLMLTTAMMMSHSAANAIHYVNDVLKVNDSESIEE